MQCELCGRESHCHPATIDNVRMMLCPDCLKQHGKSVREPTSSSQNMPILSRIKRPKNKDVYEGMNKELVTNWNNIIKNAREKKKISREELGFRIGERTVTIAKIENGDLRPSDKIVEKLEKELGVKLIEDVKDVSNVSLGSHQGRGLTLGDFIKKEEK
jgi:putative transcription factor